LAGGVFVSYRRDDAAHITGRIADAIAARIGRDRVFVDVDSVAPGEDFVRKIERSIHAADTFIAVIGSNWLTASTPQGQRRIDLDGDFIRLEVRTALNSGMRIVPVLVDNAPMPRGEDLPEDVRQLVRHNAVHLSHTTFTRDIQALLDTLDAKHARRALKIPALALPLGAGVVVAATLAFTLMPRTPPPLATSIGLAEKPAEEERWMGDTRFRVERNGGRMEIRAELPYRDRMREEKRIDGIAYLEGTPLGSPMPDLLVQVTNTSSAPITINEVQFEVIRADPDLGPLPILREHRVDVHRIRMVDEGWGKLEEPRLTITAWGSPETDPAKINRTWKGVIVSPEPCAAPSTLTNVTPFTVDGVEEEDAIIFDLAGRVPRALVAPEFVCAIGQLAFNASTGPQALAVRTRVSNHPPDALAAAPAIGFFDLYLDPDREGYVAVVPVQREIAAGATEAIPIRIITDKSSDFELRHSVAAATGEQVTGETFTLQIFKSRNDMISYIEPPAVMKPLTTEDIAAAGAQGIVASGNIDPEGRSPASFTLTRTLDDAACADFLANVAPRILAPFGGVPEGGIESTSPDGDYCDSD
jgi:hypothetical protein